MITSCVRREFAVAKKLTCVALIALLSFSAYSQSTLEPLSAIPPELRKRLSERLHLFADFQRTKNWQAVSELLGDYYEPHKRIAYTPEQKNWMIDQLNRSQMLSFTPQSSSWSTAVLSLPVSKRYWLVEGVTEFSEGHGIVKERATLVAYLQNGDWYFCPFIRNECGEVQHPQVPDFSPEGRAEQLLPVLSLSLDPNLPIEVYELSIMKTGGSACSKRREFSFKVKNRSRKLIAGYGFEIEDLRKEGSVSVGLALQSALKPGETSVYEGEYYTGIRPHLLRFRFVRFADGTYWRRKKSLER